MLDIIEFTSSNKLNLLEHIIQNIADPLLVYLPNGKMIYSNQAYLTLSKEHSLLPITNSPPRTHTSFYDFKGKKIEENDLPTIKALRGEYVRDADLRVVPAAKRVTYSFYASTYLISLQDIQQKCILLILKDVSRELHEEQNRKDFIQIAAHEMRTPLTSIKGFIQLVLERYRERDRKWFFQPTTKIMAEMDRDQSFFNVILDEALRLDELTNELLSIFKIDQGKFEMEFVIDYPTKIIRDAIEEYSFPNQAHQIHQSIPNLDILLKMDIKQIKRVVHNLLSNAVKYSPRSKHIYIRLEQEEDAVVFSVRDEGIGIPKEQQDRIFERFYRAYSPEQEDIHGYGVGLHICQEILKQHGGRIWFSSEYGEGSTFYFRLPIYKQECR